LWVQPRTSGTVAGYVGFPPQADLRASLPLVSGAATCKLQAKGRPITADNGSNVFSVTIFSIVIANT